MHTKLAAPNVEDAIARPRLFERLDRARERPVVWIGAPAGSGKSTLVASYARARALRCLWYGVDARDGDPGTLFYYLGQAVRQGVSTGAPALPILAMDHPTYVDAPPDMIRQAMAAMGMPPWAVSATAELFEACRQDQMAAVAPTVANVLGRPAIGLDRFVNDQRDAFS